jgi:glyoxylase-like metal-dependent hydrolase (beta-lactamase superfamily II)
MKRWWAALAACSFAFAQGYKPPAGATKQIAPNLYVMEAPFNGAEGPNLAFYVTPKGVVAVDDRIDQNYEYLVERIRAVTTQPLTHVIVTHHHGEQRGAYLKALPEVKLVGHKNAAKHLRDAGMFSPQILFDGEFSLFPGDTEIRLIHPGPAHTDGDVAIYFPAAKVIYVGDLMAATDTVTNPTMDYANGGALKTWPGALDGLMKLDFDQVIPGTGIGVVDKAALARHRDKLKAVAASASAAVHTGKSKDEISQMLVKDFAYKPINLRSVDGMLVEFSK